jgi:hypothetical protein
MPAAQDFLAILIIADVAFSRTTRIVAAMFCCVVGEPASHAWALVRQHFLKQDAVFLGVLVYSG